FWKMAFAARRDPIGIIRYQLYHTMPSWSTMKPKPLNSAQIRAARALLRWSAAELAREAALGLATIKRAELADGETSITMANHLAVRPPLEPSGVQFIEENGGGPGVRLRQRRRPKTPKK